MFYLLFALLFSTIFGEDKVFTLVPKNIIQKDEDISEKNIQIWDGLEPLDYERFNSEIYEPGNKSIFGKLKKMVNKHSQFFTGLAKGSTVIKGFFLAKKNEDGKMNDEKVEREKIIEKMKNNEDFEFFILREQRSKKLIKFHFRFIPVKDQMSHRELNEIPFYKVFIFQNDEYITLKDPIKYVGKVNQGLVFSHSNQSKVRVAFRINSIVADEKNHDDQKPEEPVAIPLVQDESFKKSEDVIKSDGTVKSKDLEKKNEPKKGEETKVAKRSFFGESYLPAAVITGLIGVAGYGVYKGLIKKRKAK